MLNINKHTKTKPIKPKRKFIFKNCSCVCIAYHCAQLSYTTQLRTVLIIFSVTFQTIITAQIMSTGEGYIRNDNCVMYNCNTIILSVNIA